MGMARWWSTLVIAVGSPHSRAWQDGKCALGQINKNELCANYQRYSDHHENNRESLRPYESLIS